MQNTTIEGYRLSPQQAHLWLLQQGDEGSVYQARCAVAIEGQLNRDVLRSALEGVVARHEILRTSFRYLPAMTIPLQVISENGVPLLQEANLRDLGPGEQAARLEALYGESSEFDFEQGPLLSAFLVALSPQRHILLLKLPALCADVVGLENLVREISLFYGHSFGEGGLTEDPMQYADLSEWQNELLESEETEAGRAYWRKQDIADFLNVKLPFEHGYSATEAEDGSSASRFSPRSHSFDLGGDLLEKIEALARRYETSTSVFLLACWQILLFRLTGQSDLIVGTCYDGRKYEELKDALGLFAKYLPVRGRLEAKQRISQIIEQLNDATNDLHKWQEYFTWEHLDGLNGDAAEVPFFPYCFDFVEPASEYSAAGVRFSIEHRSSCIDRFRLKLSCVRGDDVLGVTFHYDSQLYSSEDVVCLAGQFERLLQSVVSTPEAGIDALEILTDSEREQLLFEFNDTVREFSDARPIHELISEQAARRPDGIAVVVEDEELSYGELNGRANRLAHHLQGLGVGPEVLVGICVERSLDLLVGVLGILKAGGAYVPLDPVLPGERLGMMLEDAQPLVLLTQEGLAGSFSEFGGEVLCLDRDWGRISQESSEDVESGVELENLVYVLFTSGSTGRPKGVGVGHGQLFNYVHGVLESLALPLGGSFATVTTFAADLGNTAVFPTLCTGGCLHVISQECASDPAALSDYFGRHGVDCLKIVPSHLSALLGSSGGGGVLPGERLVVGGEAFSWELAERLRGLVPGCRIFNHYGPTETTVGVITYEVGHRGVSYSTATVPLGRPIANTQIYILDGHFRPVPKWVGGEVYIGGLNVARGYLGRADLTAERFVPNGYGAEPGSRVYRTGDLARYLPDGNIEFLGRVDHQVKIRGFRIELGEVEAVLSQHSGVRESVVVVHEDEVGEKRLVAYVVLEEGSGFSSSDIRGYLQESLPDYMVPSSFVELDSIPLTANGKVDRAALPAPESVRSGLESAYVAPRTLVEEMVAGIWGEILGIEQVGINDNFFELGGHSLMATQLISRVREACQVELPLRQLFDGPTVSAMAEYIESAKRTGEAQQAPPIERVSRDQELPLSFAQQRLWFLDQLEPGSSFYNVFAPAKLKGQLNLWALEQTLTEIVRRHEVLRTTFPTREGRPCQVIAPAKPVSLPVIDLTELPDSEREAEAQRVATEEAHRPFDLARGPLFRTMLLKLEDDEYSVLLTMHHIISDGWSSGILIREVASLYEAFCTGKPASLPELPIQYADFALWQREWLQGEVLETQLSYWKQRLGGTLPVLDLPTDRPRPAVQRFRGAHQSLELSTSLSEALKTLSQQEGVTLFMILLAAFKTLLHRYTGQEDIIVGSPIANRNRVEIESLVGFFVNTLVLRTDLSGNPTFQELVSRVREVALEASTHQDLPFEKLVDELQPDRDLSRTPIFQVMFVLGNLPRGALELPGLTLTPLEVEGGTAKFDLTLYMLETEEGIAGRVEYNTDLFEDDTIRRMMEHFNILLESIVENPNQRISDLNLLREAEQHQLLFEWNKTDTIYPKGSCVHQRFEAQVERCPESIAAVFENERLSYGQLNARANQLAHHLQSLGVGPDVLVAIYMERSLDMVIGILGILKAGGAYVPLDPAYPKERLAFMLEDTRAPVILTQQQFIDGLPEHKARVICLDTDWEVIARESEENPVNGVTADSLAYVIYTSGSTGKPKGVLVSHYNVTRLFEATDSWYNFNEHDVWTLFHSYAFDFSVWELWGALLYGGRLIVVPYWVSRSPEAFYELVGRERVTVLNQTPSAFRQFIRAEETATVARDLDLRLVIFGGEALELQSLRPWFERHGDQRPQLVNMYGITETTVHVTYRPITMKDLSTASGSVIGGAIPDLRVYVLDQHLQPVPIGVPGEMYVGGAGVARGYLRRPELCAERFIPNPFVSAQEGASGPEAEARLYKTGDLVRYLPNGDIEYLGRIDHQVKIRGFRIELGEIEAALDQHPGIREAVVLAREDKPNEKRLVAYLVASREPAPSVTELRDFLKDKLPDYMVPAAYVILDALPLTANGKVDRRALPEPEATRPELEEEFVAPGSHMEQVLAGIWQEVLGLEKVGIHDNFFELGGDSIISIQIIAKANQAGIRLTPKQIFQHQTIAELASVAGTGVAIQAEQGVVTGPVPLTPIQHWFFEQNLPEPNHWNQAVLFEVRPGASNEDGGLTGSLDPVLLEKAVRQLLVHHDALRLRFVQAEVGAGEVKSSTKKTWQQFNAEPGDTAPFSWIDLSAMSEAEQTSAIEATAAALQTSLDLSEGPLMRVALFDVGPEKPSRLLIVIHHLAIDGVSWRILLEDLQTSYEQLSADQAIQLPPKTTSFKYWAEKLTEYAQSDEVKKELTYWLAETRTNVDPLPVDFPEGRNENTEASCAIVSVSLDAEETRALLQEVPEAYRTRINDVLLTALVQSFSKWTGRKLLLVDLEGHGREPIFEDVDLSRTVGWFTSIFPVVLDLEKSSDPGEALKTIKEQLRSIPSRGIGYGLLRYLNSDPEEAEKLQQLPQAEISFNYLGQFDQAVPESSPFAPARESSGPVHSLRGNRAHLLEVRGSITGGKLHLVWVFSKNIHRASTIERLAEEYMKALRSLIAHCQSTEVGGYTPSDFPLAKLDQDDIDKAFEDIEFEGR